MSNSQVKPQSATGTPSFRHRLLTRLVGFSMLIGILLGLVLGTIQLTLDFQREQQTKEIVIQKILSSVASAAADAAYHIDKSRGQAVISGLFVFPAVYKAEIVDDFGGILVTKSLEQPSTEINIFARILLGAESVHKLELLVPELPHPVGKLRVWIDLNLMAKDFTSRVWLVLITGLLQTMLLTGLLAVLFYLVLARPLIFAVTEIRNNRQQKSWGKIVTIPDAHKHDEFGLLLTEFNTLVTEREQANTNMSKTLDTSPVPLSITRLADGLLLYVNPAAMNMLGITSSNFTEIPTSRFYQNPEDRIKLLARLTSDGEIGEFEIPMLKLDGSKFWASVSAKLSLYKDESVIIAGLIDITEQKTNAKKLLEQLDELRRWQEVTMGREERVLQLKQEVNRLLIESGKSLRYTSVEGYKQHD